MRVRASRGEGRRKQHRGGRKARGGENPRVLLPPPPPSLAPGSVPPDPSSTLLLSRKECAWTVGRVRAGERTKGTQGLPQGQGASEHPSSILAPGSPPFRLPSRFDEKGGCLVGGEEGMPEAPEEVVVGEEGKQRSKHRRQGGTRRWKYELGRTLGEGNFGKVKYAQHVDSGRDFAIKILDKQRILDLKIDDQIRREIGTLKLLKHPNVVRLHEVSASKTKIYMVLEYVTGGELFDKIASRGRLSEDEGRKLFQQLIDAVSYCHGKGVYHRDLKPENVLVDAKGNIKVSDFGLSALPQHLGSDGLLHTTCGSPNYVAPEVLANRGYDGSTSDVWSCGVILYVILTGSLPFDDRNLAVLYQKIFKGETHIPKWLTSGAKRMIRRILDPNPKMRVTIDEIKSDAWFKKGYIPAIPDDEDDDVEINDGAFSIKEVAKMGDHENVPMLNNAFQLIGMSSCLDLSGFFEKEDVSERKIRFTSNHSPRDLFEKIEKVVTDMGFEVQKRHGKLKVMQPSQGSKSLGSLSATAEVFEVSPSLYVVELRKLSGDSSLYRQLCTKLSNDLGDCKSQKLLMASGEMLELPRSEAEQPTSML